MLDFIKNPNHRSLGSIWISVDFKSKDKVVSFKKNVTDLATRGLRNLEGVLEYKRCSMKDFKSLLLNIDFKSILIKL